MNSSHQNQLVKQQLSNQIETCSAAHSLASLLANKMEFDVTFQVELGKLDDLTKQIANEQLELTNMLGNQGMERLPTSELRDLAAKLAEQIKQLIPLFDLIEKRVDSARSRLNPEQSQAIQTKRMHTAYTNCIS